jgi:hypothetical protein
MKEYKAYKNLVKHNRRINRVFSEVSSKNSFRSPRPGVDKKAPAVAVASCSAAPPKAPRRRSSKKGKSSTDDTSSATICPDKTKSLESSKWKRKTSEAVLDAKIQAASSLAQLGQKKIKTTIKKIVTAEVHCVPCAFDDDMIAEPRLKGFSSCLWCDSRFNIHHSYSLGSENELVDIESFSDGVTGAEKTTDSDVIADAGGAAPHPSSPQDEASAEFTRDLERTVRRNEDPIDNLPVVETREELPEGQDPSPSVTAFN